MSTAAEGADSAVSPNHRSMTPSMIMVSLPGKIARVCNIEPSQDLGRYREYLSDICTRCAIARGLQREVPFMANLIPWSTVEIGDLDIFTPMLPSLVVYTWYVDDQPESTITYFWRDEDTGMIHQEHLVVAPLTFEEAVTKAQEEAPKRSVDRIHVKHARSSTKPVAKAKRATKAGATRLKKRVPAKRKPARRSRSA